MNNIIAATINIISIVATVETTIGLMVTLAPTINNKLNILLPITLPVAMSNSPFLVATTDVTYSGKDVPIATIVKPIKF